MNCTVPPFGTEGHTLEIGRFVKTAPISAVRGSTSSQMAFHPARRLNCCVAVWAEPLLTPSSKAPPANQAAKLPPIASLLIKISSDWFPNEIQSREIGPQPSRL